MPTAFHIEGCGSQHDLNLLTFTGQADRLPCPQDGENHRLQFNKCIIRMFNAIRSKLASRFELFRQPDKQCQIFRIHSRKLL